MDLAKHNQIAHRGHGESLAAQDIRVPVPAWGGLLARLTAAHALRREMAVNNPVRTALCGSFSDWPLPACDKVARKQIVNLKDSTDRKGPWGRETHIAALFDGDREQ